MDQKLVPVSLWHGLEVRALPLSISLITDTIKQPVVILVMSVGLHGRSENLTFATTFTASYLDNSTPIYHSHHCIKTFQPVHLLMDVFQFSTQLLPRIMHLVTSLVSAGCTANAYAQYLTGGMVHHVGTAFFLKWMLNCQVCNKLRKSCCFFPSHSMV